MAIRRTLAEFSDDIATADIADNSVTLAKMAGGTDGQIITYDASGDPVAVGPGTDGQVLTSTGAGSPPAFEAGFNADAAQVFNESGADVDFRIESDDNANMFFVDGGNDRIGIGTNTPLGPTHSYISSGNAFSTAWNGWGGDNLILHNNVGAGSNAVGGAISFCAPAGSAGGADAQRACAITAVQTASDQDMVGLDFYTHPSGSYSAAMVQAMRIKHTGDIGINTPDPGTAKLNILQESNEAIYTKTSSGGQFYVNSSGVIYAQNTTVQSISDERLKKDIVDFSGGLEIVKQMKPRTFKWKNPEYHNDKSDNQYGFIAQELLEIENAEKLNLVQIDSALGMMYENEVDLLIEEGAETGEANLSGYAEKDAIYVSAIQELSVKNDTLEARVTALENA